MHQNVEPYARHRLEGALAHADQRLQQVATPRLYSDVARESGKKDGHGSHSPPVVKPIREILIPEYLFSRNGIQREVNLSNSGDMQMFLKMPVVIGSKKRVLNILVDSGAQVDLIRLGLFSEHLRNAQNPVRLRMANGMPMLG